MKRIIIPIAVVFVLAICYFACCAAVDKERILPRTSVNGVDIGGMEVQEAVRNLQIH